MKDEEKEIKHIIYLKSQEIKSLKQDIKELHWQLDEIAGTKKLNIQLVKGHKRIIERR